MEKIMSKTTMHNSEASLEVHELKHELSEAELNHVSGGTLLEAALKGHVFKKVEIHATA
jgi:bacteriocin-like protein